MRKLKFNKVKIMMLMLLVFSMTLIPMLMQPLVFQLAVKMSDDKAVDVAVKTLESNGPKPIVVTYNSPMYHLLVWRACAGVIWIGHADQNGVLLLNEKVSWEKFAKHIKQTPSKDIILTCYSQKILAYTEEAITFGDTPIDAVIGANLISYILTGEIKPLKQAVERAIKIAIGKEKPTPLYLSEEETAYWLAVVVLTTIAILLNWYFLEYPP